MSARRDAALDYAAAWMPVFPLVGKKPRNDNGVTGASADLQKVADWWRRALVRRQTISSDLMRMLDWLDIEESA